MGLFRHRRKHHLLGINNWDMGVSQGNGYLLLKMCKETFEGAGGIIESKR
ncbi:hypothetical protein Hdeb2414_s0017g00506361 [Helianthus debilis subsp. tardiflorus]